MERHLDSKLKVGIVGCGFIAKKRHIPAFQRLRKKVVVAAVCDKDENLAKRTANEYAIPQAYSDLEEMLSQEKLDMVDICTPPQMHAPLAVAAINRGCHILMEKPMALTTSHCDQMINASLQKQVKLCIVHNVLFHPPFLKARKLVSQGAIGDFIGMRIFLSDPRHEMVMKKDYWIHKLPGGLIGETGPHAVYMSLAFLNKIQNVDVYAKNFLEHPWAPFDEFRIELEAEKAVSSIAISYASNRYTANVDILGTEGALYLDLQSMLIIRYPKKTSLDARTLAITSLDTTFQTMGGLIANSFKVITRKVKLGHDAIIEKFVDTILSDQPPPVLPEEGRETVKVMEMIVDRLHQKYGRYLPHPNSEAEN